MAGANNTGLLVAIAVNETKSSDRPFAIFDIDDAVAGAMSMASQRRAISTWDSPSGAAGSNISTYGTLAVIALNAKGCTNCVALFVIITSTVAPACTSLLAISRDL